MIRGSGFREVYAGIELGLYEACLSGQIADEVASQQKYILLMLAVNGINHGHAFYHNLNLRFLLKTLGKPHQVVFDLNYAIQLAKQNQSELVPILTLRDWDQAVS
jgi:hypothetical protein